MINKFSTHKQPGMRKVHPVPEWQRYVGFSFLFNNPGDNFCSSQGISKLENNCNGESLALYHRLESAIDRIGGQELMNQHLLFPLPSSTYHVTAWDGINSENIHELLSSSTKDEIDHFISNIPNSIDDGRPTILPQSEFENASQDWTIRLKFKHLRLGGETVLMAVLVPADEESEKVLKLIKEERQRLDDLYNQYGKTPNATFMPHVALAYLSNSNEAKSLYPKLEAWINDFDNEVGDQVIKFNNIGLYAFSDMVSYYRI